MGYTALLQAALGDQDRCMKDLIETGADVNIQNQKGGTALWYAVAESHGKSVQLLIRKGAKVNMQKATGWIGLAYCSKFRKQFVQTFIGWYLFFM